MEVPLYWTLFSLTDLNALEALPRAHLVEVITILLPLTLLPVA